VDQRALKNILKLLSVIGISLGIFFWIPIAAGIYYGELCAPIVEFDLVFLGFNVALFLHLREHTLSLTLKEGILSVNLIWMLVGVAGAIPLWLCTDITLVQGFFEAISGFTTTGATVYAEIDTLPKMVLMLRSLMHWLGGMGILVLGVGLFSLINPSGSLALFKSEATGVRLEKATPKIKDTAMRLWGIYVLLTAADALLLHWEGMGFFDAINHAMSTISTGGFSTRTASLGAFDTPSILWTTTFFMMASGINFLAHLKLFHGDLRGYRSEETVWYILIFLILGTMLSLVRFGSSDATFGDSVTHAFFNIASLLTTTGFVSVDYETWGRTAVVLCFAAMLFGGNGGSTAGGAKVIRFVVSAKVIGAEVKKILHPNAIVNIFIDRSPVSITLVQATYGFMMLFSLTNIFVAFYLYAAGYDALTAASAAIACVANVGPGFGGVGPACNYGIFDDLDAMVLALGMILGRLEFYTFFLMLIPAFWKRF
jgi:trk system potassium uptake protein TrkH